MSTIGIGSKLYNVLFSRPHAIVGQTSRSWLVKLNEDDELESPIKIPKSGISQEWWTADEQEWKESRLARDHRYHVARAIEYGRTKTPRPNPKQLIEIAKIIGYEVNL